MTYEWQKGEQGTFPVLEDIGVKELRECLKVAIGREDVRIVGVNHVTKDDHVRLFLELEIR
jgi:hypothetical protein